MNFQCEDGDSSQHLHSPMNFGDIGIVIEAK